jgi:hypothetical protein
MMMMKKFKKPTVYLKISIAPIDSLCDRLPLSQSTVSRGVV